MNEKLEQLINTESCDFKDLFAQVDDLFDCYDFEGAISLLEKIPKGHKDYPKVLYRKSLCIYEFDESESFKLFQEALSLEFNNSNENHVFGNKDDSEELLLFAMNMIYVFEDFTNAIRYLDLSLKINPNQGEAWNFKAISFGFLGMSKKAIKCINRAIKIEPNNAKYWNNKGAVLLDLKHISKALKAFDKAIELEPNADSWSNKGTLYYRSNEYVKALNCYDEAIKLNPNDISAITSKASIYSELGQFKLADWYFEMAEKIDSTDFAYLVEMGKHLLNKCEFKRSIEFFDRSIEINEDFALPWMYKSMALSELGKDDESQLCFKKAIELDPDSISIFDEVIVIED